MDEGIIAMLVMPLVIFMIFVAPIWLILHYRSKKQVNVACAPPAGRRQVEPALENSFALKADV